MEKTHMQKTLDRMLQERIVAVVRLDDPAACLDVAGALREGGISIVEITMTTPGALRVIRTMREAFPDLLVGAGSVLTREDVDACVDAGAAFQVAPILDPRVLEYALKRDILFSPGTFTPSEAYAAWVGGAPLVKVFPAARVGAKFVSDLKAPMPFLRLMPTGGVNSDTIHDLLKAGADVVGAGSWLVNKKAIQEGDYDTITCRAKALVDIVRNYAEAADTKDVASGGATA